MTITYIVPEDMMNQIVDAANLIGFAESLAAFTPEGQLEIKSEELLAFLSPLGDTLRSIAQAARNAGPDSGWRLAHDGTVAAEASKPEGTPRNGRKSAGEARTAGIPSI